MNWYEKIKKYYDKGYYTNEDLDKFVKNGKITQEEADEISGRNKEEIE